ncbi:putative N-acetyltransferase YvbK [compost metagenome]
MTPSFTLRELPVSAAPWDLLLLADPSRAQIERYLPDSSLLALMIDDAEPAGVLVLTPREEGYVEITNLAVAEAWQRRGLGRRLLEATIEAARQQGIERLEIATGNSSLDQLGLYQRCGFRIVGVEPDYFLDHYPELISENGIVCRDRILLALWLD